MKIKDCVGRFYRWEYCWLVLIVLATLILHLAMVTNPSDLILDEKHYIKDARNILENHETTRIEHPPLAKLLIVTGIKIFGDNPWGWRVLPILFSTATIVLFYFLCRRLDMSRTASSIAAFLLAFENLTFLMGSLAMLDVFYVTFMMAAFLLYAGKKYVSSGVAIGLSTLAKLNGVFSGLTVVLHWIYSYKQERNKRFTLTVVFAVVAFIGLMVFFDYLIVQKPTDFLNPLKRIYDMLSLSGGLTFEFVEHPSESPPWEWLYTYKPMPFNYMPHYTAAISFSIWPLIIPAFVYMVWRARKKDEAGLFGAVWFIATYLIWIPAILITDRVTYIYYFYPAVGAVCLGLGMALAQLIDIFKNRPRGKLKWFALSAVIFILAAHVLSFLILSPFIPVDFAKLVGLSTIQP